MQTSIEYLEPTKVKLSLSLDAIELHNAKQIALNKLASSVSVSGYRQGKAPLSVVEKQLEPNLLSQETLEQALSDSYAQTLQKHNLHPVSSPEVVVKSYVPYNSLNFETTTEVIGKIKVGKYSGLKIETDKQPVVKASDVQVVLSRLQKQFAERKPVQRAAKLGDEVVIDFAGEYADSGELINGASGKDYPLELGSESFIPGFETKLVGIKPGEELKVELVFPKDYQAAFLRNKKAIFKVSAKSVNQLSLPKIDDLLAKKIGPFASLSELQADIKRELKVARDNDNNKLFQNQLMEKIVDTSSVDMPQILIDDESAKLERELRDNAAYRGLTWSEYLRNEGLSEEEFKKQLQLQSTKSVKAGLVIGEIASELKIRIEPTEIDSRIAALKKQYASDSAMQAELDKKENRNDLQSRILVEKTIQRLVELNS
jgi:trigger factor